MMQAVVVSHPVADVSLALVDPAGGIEVRLAPGSPGRAGRYGEGLQMSPHELGGVLSASSTKNSVLIAIDVTGPDPELIADIANAVGQSFTDMVTTVLEKPWTGCVIRRGGGDDAVGAHQPEEHAERGPGLPVRPQVVVGLTVLRTTLETRVQSLKDLHQISELLTLGTIVDDPKASKDPLMVRTRLQFQRAESFRSLGTNLQFANVDGNTRSFVIIASGEIALSSLLVGMVELQDMVRRWGKEEVFVLPAGRIPLTPSRSSVRARFST